MYNTKAKWENSIKSEWIEQDNQKVGDQIGFLKNDSTMCCLQ